METCCHELYARFVDYDSEVTMACLSEWNQMQDPESIVAESAQPSHYLLPALLRTICCLPSASCG